MEKVSASTLNSPSVSTESNKDSAEKLIGPPNVSHIFICGAKTSGLIDTVSQITSQMLSDNIRNLAVVEMCHQSGRYLSMVYVMKLYLPERQRIIVYEWVLEKLNFTWSCT